MGSPPPRLASRCQRGAPLLVLLALVLTGLATSTAAFVVVAPPRAAHAGSSSSVRRRVLRRFAAAAPSNATAGTSGSPPATTPRRRPGSSGPNSSNRRPARGPAAPTVIEFSMRRAGYTPAIDLLEAALGAGTAPEACEEGLFGAALRECRSVGDGPRALRYLGLAPESQLREMDFANAIHACAATGSTGDGRMAALLDEALGAFRRLQGLGRREARAGPRSYAAVILACSRGGRPEEARRFFEEMDGRDGRPAPDAACVAAMMETYRRQGQPQAALDLLLDGQTTDNNSSGDGSDSSTFLLARPPPDHHLTLAGAVRALSDLGRPGEGVALFEAARAAGGSVDGGCYAAALDALADLGDAVGALRLLDAMHAQDGEAVAVLASSSSSSRRQGQGQGQGMRPVARLRAGRQHYVAALRACAKAGAWEEALDLVEGMRDRSGVRPDEKCFRWALFACCAAGEAGVARQLLEGRAEVPWSLPCYTTAMRALAKAEAWEDVLALWDLLGARNLAPDAATGDVALSAAGAARLWAKAEAVLGELQRRGIEPYEAGYGVVIEGRCQQGRLGDALALLRRVRRPNVVMYTSILCALGRQGKVQQALSLLREMEGQKGIAPDQVALTCVVDACLKAGAVDDAARLAARLDEAAAQAAPGGTPDELSFGVRVRALLEQGEWAAARGSLLEAESKGMASHLSYSLLINAAARDGRWRDAVGMLLHMRGRGVAVSALDISSAINACRLAGELPTALALLRVLDARRRREEEEEDPHEGVDPYQASCGLVLDLLAKKVPPVRGAAARRRRRLPWHRPPGGEGEGDGGDVGEGDGKGAAASVVPKLRRRPGPRKGGGKGKE